MTESKHKLVVLLTAPLSSDRASIALTLANASLTSGMEVMLFLMSDGVDLSREGATDVAHFPPFSPLAELVEKFRAEARTLGADLLEAHLDEMSSGGRFRPVEHRKSWVKPVRISPPLRLATFGGSL